MDHLPNVDILPKLIILQYRRIQSQYPEESQKECGSTPKGSPKAGGRKPQPQAPIWASRCTEEPRLCGGT